MIRYIIIILTVVYFFFCSSPNGQVNNSNNQDTTVTLNKKGTSLYKPNTNSTTKGEYSPFALEDLKLGNRLLLDKMPQSEIIKHKIKSICREDIYIEKFDEKGFKIFEKWSAWYAGSSFKYEFDKDEKPLTISVLDTNNMVIGTAKYKYNKQGKLLRVGVYILKYYPNGKLKSIEDTGEIESYEYDSNGNLNHINFDWQPGVVGCGNGTTEWKGEYNDRKQLIKEQIFGFPDGTTKYFEYTSNGQISKTNNISSMGNKKTTTEFIYTDGLLTQTKTFDHTGKLQYVVKWKYEKY